MRNVLLGATLLLIAAGCNANQQKNNTPPAQTAIQTYRNSGWNFEFQYPKSLGFVDATYGSLQNQIVQIQIGQDQYPKTNFGDADFTVSLMPTNSQTTCLKTTVPENSNAFKDSQVINGVTFYKTTAQGVGLGNVYDSHAYRTWANKICYELTETVHTSRIENYQPGTVSAVDKNAIWARLDSILNSFKLTK